MSLPNLCNACAPDFESLHLQFVNKCEKCCCHVHGRTNCTDRLKKACAAVGGAEMCKYRPCSLAYFLT